MSIGLLANTGLRRLTPLVTCPTAFFLRAFMHRTSYELRFGRQPRVDHLRVFGCRCFVLKDGNFDKFESRSSDGIFPDYASHSRAYRVLIIGTNIVRETCEVTFDETAPCNSSIFEVAGDRKSVV